ncbi:hypothetical protein NEAUS03_1864 [Nematocida ausubeli]|nr:hypothetical protein NEAUS03_1864 [Nematocida ausubeli]
MEGIRQDQINASLNQEGPMHGAFAILEVHAGWVFVSKGSTTNKWPLQKQYKSFTTNAHLLKRGAFIGHTYENTLYLVRYLKGKEDPLVGTIESYALFDASIFYIAGKTVTAIDISTGEKKVVIENDEIIGTAQILLCENTLLLISEKIIYRLELNTSAYTKLRLRVTLDPNTAKVSKLKGQIQLVVSCEKGNVYIFEATKMEIVRSMKYFGAPISTIGFWHPEPALLFVLTTAGELMDVDCLNNRVIKKHAFPIDDYRRVVPLKGMGMAFISSNKITMYSPYTNSIRTIYRSRANGSVSFISLIVLDDVPREKVLSEMKMSEGKGMGYKAADYIMANGNFPTFEKKGTPGEKEPTEKIPVERPIRLDVEYSKNCNIHDGSDGKNVSANDRYLEYAQDMFYMHKSFERFKESVHKIHADVLKEVFQMKKRLDKIEESLLK